jgi:hypothetical protein
MSLRCATFLLVLTSRQLFRRFRRRLARSAGYLPLVIACERSWVSRLGNRSETVGPDRRSGPNRERSGPNLHTVDNLGERCGAGVVARHGTTDHSHPNCFTFGVYDLV